jgi:hypothetical protein
MASNRCSSNDAMDLNRMARLEVGNPASYVTLPLELRAAFNGVCVNPGIVDCVSALALIESAPSGAANGPCDP